MSENDYLLLLKNALKKGDYASIAGYEDINVTPSQIGKVLRGVRKNYKVIEKTEDFILTEGKSSLSFSAYVKVAYQIHKRRKSPGCQALYDAVNQIVPEKSSQDE
ncbi:hypothetical protein BKI52_02540 [marine bacterium AO1-C]|nr:hypothetical protein BKI52_02540 [marine bacterium AO1-C]